MTNGNLRGVSAEGGKPSRKNAKASRAGTGEGRSAYRTLFSDQPIIL
jgi:hypothetical protein